MSVEQAQAHLDNFCAAVSDSRTRHTPAGASAVADLAATEPLQAPPATAYPVILGDSWTASRQALVSYRGSQYSVPPELASAQVTVTRPVGGSHLDIVTASGVTVARRAVAADGLGMVVRDSAHVVALERLAMATANTGKPHRRKERIPPGPDALRAADALRGSRFRNPNGSTGPAESDYAATSSDVIDLSAYERAAQGRNTLA